MKITFEKLEDTWASPGKMAEAIGSHLKLWLGEHAKDAFFIEELSSSVEIFLYDARDGVDLKMKFHTVALKYQIREY
ncbi:MAG: hypothetical protein EOP84_07755 [Verrucomicrobiaceae bacterium]|nr:MAG: hypothetical protein EOP84_07755 [Verrucomicrobiaceae bacterium]